MARVYITGELVARVQDGTITYKDGTSLGRILPGGVVRYVDGTRVGRVGADGMVTTRDGTPVGSLGRDGAVLTVGGDVVGRVEGDDDLDRRGGAGAILLIMAAFAGDTEQGVPGGCMLALIAPITVLVCAALTRGG